MSYQPWGAAPGYGTPQPQLRGPVIPFRPLTIGNLFEGSFAAIRSNPKVMFVFSLVVMGAIGLLGGIGSAVLAQSAGYYSEFGLDPSSLYVGGVGVAAAAAQALMSLLQSLATLLVTGMLAIAVTGAVVGANRALKGTWDELKPRLLPLIGTSLLVGLIVVGPLLVAVLAAGFGVLVAASMGAGTEVTLLLAPLLLAPALALLGAFLGVRLCFATIITVVEKVGVTEAIKRSWTLTRGAFWRTAGRLILMGLAVGAISGAFNGVLSGLIGLLGSVAPVWVVMLLTAVVTGLIVGVVQPFSGSYATLMYVDERIRTEGLAPTLQAALDANVAAQQNWPGGQPSPL